MESGVLEFKPSAKFVENIVLYLRESIADLPPTRSADIETIRTECAKDFRGVMGTYAQRIRCETTTDNKLITNGVFSEEFGGMFERAVVLPEGERGDELYNELAQEFLAWAKEHAASIEWNPRGPITKLEVRGEDILIHVRPLDPPIIDPHFVPAERIE